MTKIEMTYNTQEETWWIDKDGLVRIEGLAQPGIYLFNYKRRQLYVKHPEEPTWVRLSFDKVRQNLTVLEAAKEGPWQEQYGVMSERWRVVNNKETCAYVFTNSRAASMTGLDIGAMVLVRSMLDYLYFGRTAQPCQQGQLPAALAQQMGFPTYWDDTDGQGGVTRIISTQGEVIPEPVGAHVKALTQESHVRFMQRSLPLATRQALQQSMAELPLIPQYKAIEHLLRAQRAVDTTP